MVSPHCTVTEAEAQKWWQPTRSHLPFQRSKLPEDDCAPLAKARLPRNMRNLPWDHEEASISSASGAADTAAAMLAQLGTQQPPKLARDWTCYAYTDGSCIREEGRLGLGSGCYAAGGGEDCPEVDWRIDPTAAQRWEPHVLQAELVALYGAIYLGYTHIMTDSLSSLHMITKMVHSPHDMTEHRYRTLLGAIFDLVKQKQTPIHLYKVASHVGVVGNERADALAGQVAKSGKGSLPDNTTAVMDRLGKAWEGLPNSNDRGKMLWPRHRPRARVQGEAAPDAGPPAGPVGPLANMSEALRAATRATLQLGWSNLTPIYWGGWQEQLPKMHTVSFDFMKNLTLVPWAARRAALLYRTGTLYTGKAAKWMGYAKSDLCMAGCGQPDGIHHAVSACPKLEPQRTKRHNEAGLRIARALQHNGIEATIHSADVGSQEAYAAAGLQSSLPPEIGYDLLPRLGPTFTLREYTARERLALRRPDIVFVQKPQRAGQQRKVIHLVEIKYCRDAWPEQQEQRALDQYADLAEALRSVPDQEVQYHTVMLGVAGTVYRDTEKTLLERFMLTKQHTRETLTDLHKHAILSLQNIIKTRRCLEKGVAATGKRRRRMPTGVT